MRPLSVKDPIKVDVEDTYDVRPYVLTDSTNTRPQGGSRKTQQQQQGSGKPAASVDPRCEWGVKTFVSWGKLLSRDKYSTLKAAIRRERETKNKWNEKQRNDKRRVRKCARAVGGGGLVRVSWAERGSERVLSRQSKRVR